VPAGTFKPTDARSAGAAAAAVALIVAGIYALTLGAPFYSDDYAYLVNNQRLRDLPLGELWRLATERFNPFEFLPLRDLSWRLELAAFGLDPAGFRAVNIGLYLTVCALVFVVSRRACAVLPAAALPQATTVAALTTVLFSVHPAHVEAVVWISGRKDLFAAGFALASLWAALAATAAPAQALRWSALAALAFVAALLSKATAVALLPIYFGLAWQLHRRSPLPSAQRGARLLAGLTALAAVSFLAFFHGASAIRVEQHLGWETVARFLAILGWLARLAISPEPRQTFYPVVESGFLPMAGVGLLALGGLAIGMLRAWRRRSLLLLPLALMLCLAMPYGQIVPFGTHSLVTDRYLFLLSWPVCFLLALLAATSNWRRGALAALAALWLFQTASYALDWRTTTTLRERALQAYPRHYSPINAMVFTELLPRGQFAEAARLVADIEDGAARALNARLLALNQRLAQDTGDPRPLMAEIVAAQKAVTAMPAQAQWNLAYQYQYAVAGKAAVSEAWRSLADRHPREAAVHFNAGLWFHEAGEPGEAARMFGAAAALLDPQSPHFAAALRRQGIAAWLDGDAATAERLLLAAGAATVPDAAAACALAKLYGETGRPLEAAAAQRRCRGA